MMDNRLENNTGIFENVLSFLCVKMNKMPSEMQEYKLFDILKMYSYIKFINKKEEEEMEREKQLK